MSSLPPETLLDCLERRLSLFIDCAGCGRIAQVSHGVPLEGLARQVGKAMPITGLKRRFRCSICGGRPASIRVRDVYGPRWETPEWTF